MTSSSSRAHQARIFLLLVTFSTSIYLLTYRAAIQTGDTLRALDAVTSVSRYGDWLMDESSWSKPDSRIRKSRDLPLSDYDVEERLNIRLATALLKLAEVLPRLGNIHTVWLFNLFITALCVGLIYLILRAMAYRDMVAVLVSIGAALGTNLWAYSQTFFREPLTTFFILIALFSLQVGQNRRAPGRIISLVLAAAGLFLAYEAKQSAALAIPALVLFALPGVTSRASHCITQALYRAPGIPINDPLLLYAGRSTSRCAAGTDRERRLTQQVSRICPARLSPQSPERASGARLHLCCSPYPDALLFGGRDEFN